MTKATNAEVPGFAALEDPSGPHPDGRVAWLRYAMLCDSSHVENTGKRILVGCYDAAVVFQQRPALLSARLVGIFEFLKPGAHTLEFRVSTPAARGVGRMETLETAPAGSLAPFDVPVEALVQEDGEIRLDWRLDEQPWGPPMIWKLAFSPEVHQLAPEAASALEAAWNETVKARVAEGEGTLAPPDNSETPSA